MTSRYYKYLKFVIVNSCLYHTSDGGKQLLHLASGPCYLQLILFLFKYCSNEICFTFDIYSESRQLVHLP